MEPWVVFFTVVGIATVTKLFIDFTERIGDIITLLIERIGG